MSEPGSLRQVSESDASHRLLYPELHGERNESATDQHGRRLDHAEGASQPLRSKPREPQPRETATTAEPGRTVCRHSWGMLWSNVAVPARARFDQGVGDAEYETEPHVGCNPRIDDDHEYADEITAQHRVHLRGHVPDQRPLSRRHQREQPARDPRAAE